MTKTIIIFVAMFLVSHCGAKQETPKTSKKQQDNVYHVFDQDLEVQENEITEAPAESEKKPENLEIKEEPKTVLDEESPLAVVQQYTQQLQDLDEKTRDDKLREQKIASTVRNFFDFPTLAKESLGTHWFKINAHDQREYSDLFIELVERSYLTRSQSLVGNYDLEYKPLKTTARRASVLCVVKKDDVDIDITYHLHKIGNKWMIYNIVFDNVDLIRNYQNQFGRIIAKSKFSGLVDTMRKKLDSDDAQIQM